MLSRVLLVGFLSLLFLIPSQAVFADNSKPIILKQINYIPSTIGLAQVIKTWFSELEKRSNGRIKVKHFWSGSMASAKDIPSFVAKNIAQCGEIGAGYKPDMFKLIRVADLPFLAKKSDALARALLQSLKDFKPLREEFEKLGLKPIFFEMPDRAPLACRKPAYKVSDLKGWKIRSYGQFSAIVKAWAGTPVAMPFGDIPEALERGVIDAATGVWFTSYNGMKIPEIVNYSVDTGNRFNTTLIQCMSIKFYNSLPKDLQQIVDELTNESWRIYGKAYAIEIEKSARSLAKTKMEFIQWTPQATAEAKKVALPVAEKMYFDEMTKRGLEKEAKELYVILKKRAAEYAPESMLPDPFSLVAKYRKDSK